MTNTTNKTRVLGNSGIEVSPLGYGCMGLSHAFETPLIKQEGADRIKAAFDMGYTMFDTAECYTGTNPDGTTACNEKTPWALAFRKSATKSSSARNPGWISKTKRGLIARNHPALAGKES